MNAGYNKTNPIFPDSIEEIEEIVKDVFNSIAERDIYTGRSVFKNINYKIIYRW